LLQFILASNAYALFWYLALAHWLGDYPLQSDWMARHKTNFWVLLLHVTIHFVLLLIGLFPTTTLIWPYLLVLAAAHFSIDAAKNWVKVHHPTWVTWPYLVDQAFHFISLVGVALWIHPNTPKWSIFLPLPLAIAASGLLLATDVWMITEKVLWPWTRAGEDAHPLWPWKRLALRAGLYTAVLLSRQALDPWMFALASWLPYNRSQAGKRALLTDILVGLLVALVINLALSGGHP
jgi:hypothetical protein